MLVESARNPEVRFTASPSQLFKLSACSSSSSPRSSGALQSWLKVGKTASLFHFFFFSSASFASFCLNSADLPIFSRLNDLGQFSSSIMPAHHCCFVYCFDPFSFSLFCLLRRLPLPHCLSFALLLVWDHSSWIAFIKAQDCSSWCTFF